MSSSVDITKEFLEKVICRQIESFNYKAQADTGNNFMSVIYTFDVNFISAAKENQGPSIETVHYLCKCYPSSSGRQDFLNEQNIFWKELVFYKDWLPELQKLQEDLEIKEVVKPDFPEFVAGDAVNFNENTDPSPSSDKIYQPFDNYVMMLDLCKTRGFKLPDRLLGLDKDHIMVATEAYAKFHALSWAYKSHKKIDSIKEKFPNFVSTLAEIRKQNFDVNSVSTVEEAVRSLQSSGSSSELIDALTAFKNKAVHVMAVGFDSTRDADNEFIQYYRVKPEKFLGTDIPWRVIIHGDAHLNNMMFSYNSETEKAQEVVLLDFQICRESCPMMDLVYLVYTSTSPQFRTDNLGSNVNEMLELYVRRFNYYCNFLKTEPLPGFSLDEVKHRFNRLKIFGFLMNMMTAATFLRERSEVVQLDSLTEMNHAEMRNSLVTGMSSNKRYNETISALAEEGYSQGII